MRNFTIVNITLALTLNLYATQTYNINDLTAQAIENSPDLKISSYNYDASKSRYDEAFSDYLPSVDLHLSAGTGQISDYLGQGGPMVSNNTYFGGITAEQLIYDFGKTGGNSDSFKYDSNSYSSEHKQLLSDKIRDVKTAYYYVLQAIALISVQKENVKLNKIQLYRAKKYFKAGIRTKIDVSDAKVSLLKSKLDLRKATYDLKLAYTNLDKTVGLKEIENDYEVYYKGLNFNTLYNTLIEYNLSLQESVNFAYENRYELKKQQSNIQSAGSKTDVASSGYYPSIYLDGSYSTQKSDKLKNVLPTDQWKITANIDWNLYQGGATSALTQEKQIQESIAQTDLEYTKLSIKTATTTAYINVNKTKDSVELSQEILKVSNEKFDQAGKRYEHGLSDFVELQQSRQDYIDAMASLVVDYYDYYIAVADLDNAVGK